MAPQDWEKKENPPELEAGSDFVVPVQEKIDKTPRISDGSRQYSEQGTFQKWSTILRNWGVETNGCVAASFSLLINC
jgi:hypothetical protein